MSRIKIVLIITIFWVVFIGVLIWKWPDKNVHLFFCDVGQGDALLITEGFSQVLIDTGPDETALDCLGQFMPFWDREIELLVLTHPHQDHIGGAVSVLQRYRVKEILIPAYGSPTEGFVSLRKAILDEVKSGARLSEPILGQQITLSPSSQATVVWPQEPFLMPEVDEDKGYQHLFDADVPEADLSAYLEEFEHKIENYNDGSIVLFLEIGMIKIALMGDLESPGEQALIAQQLIPDVDILKVGHHGSNTSSIPSFIATARPETAVISSGQNNRYRHPHPDVLTALEESGSVVLRTDQLGTIELISDGKRYWRGRSHRLTPKK
jgi:competence protein ComEC